MSFTHWRLYYHTLVCVRCVWIYYSFSTHGLAMRLLLLEGCAWTHECPNFTPLFERFLEDWKPENHPVYNIFYWWISHQIYRQLKPKLKERSLTLFLHSQTAMSEVIYFFFTVLTSYCGSYSRKSQQSFIQSVQPRSGGRCFTGTSCVFVSLANGSSGPYMSIHLLTYTNSYVDILYMPGFNFQFLISKTWLFTKKEGNQKPSTSWCLNKRDDHFPR